MKDDMGWPRKNCVILFIGVTDTVTSCHIQPRADILWRRTKNVTEFFATIFLVTFFLITFLIRRFFCLRKLDYKRCLPFNKKNPLYYIVWLYIMNPELNRRLLAYIVKCCVELKDSEFQKPRIAVPGLYLE
jgi:hypothetical protein